MATALSGGGTSFSTPPTGYNDHFWFNAHVGLTPAGMVDAVYVQMDMRVTDPNLHLIANVGADWWRNASAPFLSDFSNNPHSRHEQLVRIVDPMDDARPFTQQQPRSFWRIFLRLWSDRSTTEPETKPTILSYTTDSGVAGDGITNDLDPDIVRHGKGRKLRQCLRWRNQDRYGHGE